MASHGRREVPFAPLKLTLAQQQHCQDLTFQLLDRTLRSYDERDDSSDSLSGSPRHHAHLDSTRWKQLKTQTNASLYAERSSNTPRDLNLPGDIWDDPCVLLAVGTIDSNLDEVMFGLETPDFLAMQVRSEVLGKQPLDGAVLAQLAGPSEADPFQFMGVTWMVGERSWPLSMVVRPRDFVIVSATGIVNRPSGGRVGYEVVQSADLPQCPPLPRPMVRGKLMYGAVYRQREDATVDVYIQMYVETQGRLLDKLVVAAMWDSTLGFWSSPRLAEQKKLQWCLDNRSVKRRAQASTEARSGRSIEPRRCENCLRRRSLLARRCSSSHLSDDSMCALCAAPLCSSCRVRETLKAPGGRSAKLLDVDVAVCPLCMAFVRRQCPESIAMHNHRIRQDVAESDSHSSQRATSPSTFELSPLGSAVRYPSISMSELVRLVNVDAECQDTL